MTSLPSDNGFRELIIYYEGKTRQVLTRYGPGPRIHYHTGLIDCATSPGASAEFLRRALIASQERLLYHAAEIWDAPSTLAGDVLDVGCGLGGGAIFWAQEFGARVTAITCVPSHVDLVARFATEAGVHQQVRPLLCDAHEMPGEGCFDAAVAVDSSGYLARGPWRYRVAALLRPGGHLFLVDCFLAEPKYEEPFNRYWHTRIGTVAEYLSAARDAGLRVESVDDISPRTEHFWSTTIALIEAEASQQDLSAGEAVRLRTSAQAHALVREGLATRGLVYALMRFSKGRESVGAVAR